MQHSTGLSDLARRIVPDLPIESVSTPEPSLADYNVVAVYREEDDARNGVLALESNENDDAAIGLVDFGDGPDTSTRPTDARIANDALGRAVKGALIGAVIAAAVIGIGAALFSVGGIAVGAALGGAAFGAFIGGVWGAFVRFGGSSAYRQSFSTSPAAPTLVSLHTNDVEHARRASALLELNADAPPVVFQKQADDGRLVRI